MDVLMRGSLWLQRNDTITRRTPDVLGLCSTSPPLNYCHILMNPLTLLPLGNVKGPEYLLSQSASYCEHWGPTLTHKFFAFHDKYLYKCVWIYSMCSFFFFFFSSLNLGSLQSGFDNSWIKIWQQLWGSLPCSQTSQIWSNYTHPD